jgi:hypothetical protein
MMQGKFYCTTRALNSSERAHHKLLTDKLATERTQIVETEKGYEFQYSPSTVSLAELSGLGSRRKQALPVFRLPYRSGKRRQAAVFPTDGRRRDQDIRRAEFLVPAKS